MTPRVVVFCKHPSLHFDVWCRLFLPYLVSPHARESLGSSRRRRGGSIGSAARFQIIDPMGQNPPSTEKPATTCVDAWEKNTKSRNIQRQELCLVCSWCSWGILLERGRSNFKRFDERQLALFDIALVLMDRAAIPRHNDHETNKDEKETFSDKKLRSRIM